MWSLDYTISAGLGLVANTNSDGTSGLLGLAGEVVNGEVELYATNYTLSDLDPTYLFGVTDPLLATVLPGGESFTTSLPRPPIPTSKAFRLHRPLYRSPPLSRSSAWVWELLQRWAFAKANKALGRFFATARVRKGLQRGPQIITKAFRHGE